MFVVVGFQVAVGVPVVIIMSSSGVDLDEAHAALDKAAGHQAFFAEVLGAILVHAVEGFDVLGFLLKLDGLGGGGLHLVGELVGGDACGEVGVIPAGFLVALIEVIEGLDQAVLLIRSHVVDVFEVENGVSFGAERPCLGRRRACSRRSSSWLQR